MTGSSGNAGAGLLSALESFTQKVNEVFAWLAAMLVLVIMVLVCYAVVTRYFLNSPSAGALDITTFMLVFVFFLALAPALQSGSHIEVDLFDPLIPSRYHKAQRIIGKLLTLAFAIALLWVVIRFYHEIVEVDELSFTMIMVQLKYVYWIGPVGAAQFLLTAVVDLWRFFNTRPEDIDSIAAATGH